MKHSKIKATLFLGIFSLCPLVKVVAQADSSLSPKLIILGTLQDGGSPHIGCNKNCCKDLYLNPPLNRKVVSLGLVDYKARKKFLFEATPDITSQLFNLNAFCDSCKTKVVDGIFITHAHIGHYAGLMYLGREALGAKKVPVMALPRFNSFVESNGPWSQLVKLNNIELVPMEADSGMHITSQLKVSPFLVPHRDEFSETAGFLIEGPHKSALFIPDIDKWEKWSTSIADIIAGVDYAFIDATFYDNKELPGRSLKEIPHPFVIETMELLKNLPLNLKNRIYFIHFNHTNPLLNLQSIESQKVLREGFNIAGYLQTFDL